MAERELYTSQHFDSRSPLFARVRDLSKRQTHRAVDRGAAGVGEGRTRYTQGQAITGAVFLSYASKDANVARRICEALRSAGVEVWFDQSELRGGDAWDASIRKQIKECALFVPMISANTNTREEGFFFDWSGSSLLIARI